MDAVCRRCDRPGMTQTATVVATVNRPADVSEERLRAAVEETLAVLGCELIPCGWAPDPDTIAECSEVDEVSVVDLNPALV